MKPQRVNLNSLFLNSLFKDAALASVVTVQELMFSGEIIAARNYQYFTVYTVTASLYFAVGYPSALLVRRLGRDASPVDGGRRRLRPRWSGARAGAAD